MNTKLDKIRGSLLGGAIGDALGYPVEFLTLEEIIERHGRKGITRYEVSEESGKALISDDTQMTLFTANGILVGQTRLRLRGIGEEPMMYIEQSYQDWLTTQLVSYPSDSEQRRFSWLLDVPEMYRLRAPGNTCLSALFDARSGKRVENDSKGCGGIMRVAPLALHYENIETEVLDKEAADVSAITHMHPLGYMPSAVVVHIIHRILYGESGRSLKEIVVEARDAVCEFFKDNAYVDDLRNIIDDAIACAENGDSDWENIRKLGEGWVAEETLAIAIYCALRYEHDFSGGVIASVNHDGDSDSTGAVTGNILGAICGYEAIEPKWKNNLELFDVIMEMADDLCHGCQMTEYGSYQDSKWIRKYIEMRWEDIDGSEG